LQTANLVRPLLQEPDLADAHVQLTFDGPFAHPLHQDSNLCPLTPAQVAQELVAHCNTLRSAISELQPRMSVSFAWNEPVPWYSVGQYPPYNHDGKHNDFGDLLELIDLVVEAGVPISSFHADHPPEYNEQQGYDKLGALMNYVRSKRMRFGKYFNSQSGGQTSDVAFERGTLQDATDFIARLGAPDDVIVESWYSYPQVALPETQIGSLGHTTLQVAKLLHEATMV
jgi:hypothetical protein